MRPSATAGGAAGSFLASIMRIGWTPPSFNSVVTLDGTTLRLDSDALTTVGRYLIDDYQTVTAANATIASTIAN